jgi:hypothetical protein
MTLLAEPPTTDPVAALHACLNVLAGVDADQLGVARQAAMLESLTRAESRIAAIKLHVLASAQRGNAAASVGLANTGQWAARAVNADPAALARQVRLSEDLERRTGTQRAVVEAALIEKARRLPPSLLRKAARRALEQVESDPVLVDEHENRLVADEEAAARAKTRLTLHENADGTVTGHFTVPALHGQLLRKILESMSAPRRGRLVASQAQVGEAGPRTEWDHVRGSALCELIEHLPTDRLHPKTAATVVVTANEDVLRGALRVAGLDTGGVISAGEVRRLLCNASILPAVLGGASVPTDLGRSSRLFTETQRIAIGLNHQTCAAQGCQRPFAWCELHHRDPWALGGKTDLADAVPLCHFHHQRIHDRSYQHAFTPAGITFHQRT